MHEIYSTTVFLMSPAAILKFSILRKMITVYRPSADGFGLSVQKSFRINEKQKQKQKQKNNNNNKILTLSITRVVVVVVVTQPDRLPTRAR